MQSSSQPPRSVLEANVAGTGFNLNAEKLYIWVKWAPNLAFFAARFLLSSRLTLDMVCYRHGRNGAVPSPEGLSH